MRPVRMQLQGFTCYRERQDIDFSRLRLFAIAGPTGAGKSSLLDAMTFALYGEIARLGGQNLQEFVSLGASRASVTFEFDAKGERVRVVRTMPRNGPKKAQLELISNGIERRIADGVKEVDARLRDLLGLDYKAFVQSVLLPQGEFSKFLKSPPKDQRQILRDLLRLGIYERMRELAATRARELAGAMETDRKVLEGFAQATPDAVRELQEGLELINQQVATLQLRVGEARRDCDEKQRQWRLVSERQERQNRFGSLERERLSIDLQRTSLERAERAASIMPLLRQADLKAGASQRSQTAFGEISTKVQTSEAHLRLAEAAVRTTHIRAAALPEKRSRLMALNSIVPVIRERKALQSRVNAWMSELATCEQNLKRATQATQDCQASLNGARHQVELLSRERAEVGYDATVHEILKRAQIPAYDLLDARGKIASLDSGPYEGAIKSSVKSVEAAVKSLGEAESAHSAAEQRSEAAIAHLRDVETQHSAASLRMELKPGCPCPVCGQKVGAVPEHQLPEDMKKARAAVEKARGSVDAARGALDKAREGKIKSESQLQNVRNNFEEWTRNAEVLRSRAERLNESVLQLLRPLECPAGFELGHFVLDEFKRCEDLERKYAASGERLRKTQEQVFKEESALDRARSSAQNEEQTRIRLSGEITAAEERVANYDAQIANLGSADPLNETTALRNEIVDIEQEHEKATEKFNAVKFAHDELEKQLMLARERRDAAEREKSESRALADEAIRNADFADPVEVRSVFLDPVAITAARTRIREFDEDLHSTQKRIRELDELLSGISLTQSEVHEAEQRAVSLDSQLTQLNQQCGSKSKELERLRIDTERAERLRSEHEERRSKHRLVDQLSKDLQSDRFQHYLLEGSFRRLVAGASVRLRELNERYELAFSDGRFVVIDHDHGSLSRFADTLSGGETFLVSLALALELSEQVQKASGAVRLDSLFIDEGFGTLDPETLETVAEAIESLTKTNRMVGVITHVAELHRRLPRLEVRPSTSGSRVHYVEE